MNRRTNKLFTIRSEAKLPQAYYFTFNSTIVGIDFNYFSNGIIVLSLNRAKQKIICQESCGGIVAF